MESYDLNKILQDYIHLKTDKRSLGEDYNQYFKTHKKINQPDFIVVLDLGNPQPLIFEKNYNLKFDEDCNEVLQDIIDRADPKQALKILEVDSRSMEFVDEQKEIARTSIFQLRFTARLIGDQPRTLLRNISYIDLNHSEAEPLLLFVTLSDVTELVGQHNNARFNIKYPVDNEKIDKNKINAFSNEMNQILTPELNITDREHQILNLIAQGKTSKQISEELFISSKTVNTHRQNLIKKFKVKNTAALISLI